MIKNTNSLDLIEISPKVGTNSNVLIKYPIISTSNTCLRNLRIKLGSEVFLLYFGAKQLGENLELFLKFDGISGVHKW